MVKQIVLLVGKIVLVWAIAAVIAICVSPSAHAEDNHLYTGAWSFHDSEPLDGSKYNESNDLVAVQYKRLFIGTYENSYYDRTYAVGAYFPTKLKDTPVEVSLIVGASHGYRECYGPGNPGDDQRVCAMGMIEFTLNLGRLKPSIMILDASTRVATLKWEF